MFPQRLGWATVIGNTQPRPCCSSGTGGWRPLASARQLRPTNSETRSEMQRVHEAATINRSPCSCVSGFTRPGPAQLERPVRSCSIHHPVTQHKASIIGTIDSFARHSQRTL